MLTVFRAIRAHKTSIRNCKESKIYDNWIQIVTSLSRKTWNLAKKKHYAGWLGMQGMGSKAFCYISFQTSISLPDTLTLRVGKGEALCCWKSLSVLSVNHCSNKRLFCSPGTLPHQENVAEAWTNTGARAAPQLPPQTLQNRYPLISYTSSFPVLVKFVLKQKQNYLQKRVKS